MWNAIVKHQPQETSVIVVLRLNMNIQEILDFTAGDLNHFRCPLLGHFSDLCVTKWADDLPALGTVDLRNSWLVDLKPSTFCKGINLNYIDLGLNGIVKLPPLSFSPCKNLKVLRLIASVALTKKSCSRDSRY